MKCESGVDRAKNHCTVITPHKPLALVFPMVIQGEMTQRADDLNRLLYGKQKKKRG
jgi:hypothetical protein